MRTVRTAAHFAVIAAAGILGASNALGAVTISSGATQNMACSAGMCEPTATVAVLNVSDLESLLVSGAVEVTTTGSGVQANDIVVRAGLQWSTANGLTLDAYDSIVVDQHVSVSGLSALTLSTNDGGTGGVLSFVKQGNVSFSKLGSHLTINGAHYTLVKTVQKLASAIAKNPAGKFALANGYDAMGDGTYQSAPVQTTLTGTLEGLGNTISNLEINDQNQNDFVGLLASTGTGAIVENIRLGDVNISGGNDMGGLVGYANESSLYGDTVSGTIDATVVGSDSTGGLIGFTSDSTITSCISSAAVTGFVIAGGLVGTMEYSTMNDSHSTGSVSVPTDGSAEVGGLVGDNFGEGTSGQINNSYATGSVNHDGSNGYVGGLVGDNFGGSTTGSFATGIATGGDSSSVGGLVGYQDGGILTNSYATGAVSGGANSNDGGLVGYMIEFSFGDSYSSGTVAGGSGSYVGGLLGLDSRESPISDTYWDITTSGITNLSQGAGNVANDPGITGLTTAQLQSGLPPGFDPGIWAEKKKINNGLPFLIANRPRN